MVVEERRTGRRPRVLRAGKILLNNGGSVIDCGLRNLSETGACLEVTSVREIPAAFDLQINGEGQSRQCRVAWQAHNRIGISFVVQAKAQQTLPCDGSAQPQEACMDGRPASDLLRNELLRLKAGLDEVPFGVVLLDHELRAQFLNRAFRKMFRLPDSKADSKPPFVALLYHGRDIRIYDLPDNELPAYVNNRVAHVKSGDPSPIDIRLSNGEILRFQCTVLPAGGRMLTYTYVTDIVRQSDELKLLHVGLDNVNEGVILLDPQLNAQFMNRAVRQQWNVSDEQAERRPAYAELVRDAKSSKAFDVPAEELDNFVERRIALVRAGDSTPRDLHLSNGRSTRSQCSALPGGGRMLTYTDVTDLMQSAEEQMRLATT